MNHCVFVGNLVADPVTTSLSGGQLVTKFTLAVNSRRKSKNNENVNSEVAFIECEVWDKAAELIGERCVKGTKLLVEARARTESWVDKTTGNKRSALRFRVNTFEFMNLPPRQESYDDDEETNTGRPVASGNHREELPF